MQLEVSSALWQDGAQSNRLGAGPCCRQKRDVTTGQACQGRIHHQSGSVAQRPSRSELTNISHRTNSC
jgi:hypothetical protein